MVTQNNFDLHNRLNEIFTHLHANPEISWEEVNTTAYIKDLLSPYPCKITTFDDITGLVVEIGNGKPIVALRADIDALWQEVDGEFKANHSCGHDAHMTITIGTFLSLINKEALPRGTFRFIFQPAEEKGTGALTLAEKGLVDDVDYLYGMHLRPIEELRTGQFSPVIVHGAAKFIKGTIKGEDAHGARPHLNTNAIQVGTDFFQQLNNIHMNPMIPYSVKMTQFSAGGKSDNIIPGNAEFSIDLRAQTNEVMNKLTNQVQRIATMLGQYYDVDIHLREGANIAAAVTSEGAITLMKDAIIETFGTNQLVNKINTTGGDDFHFYTLKKPHIKATMLGIGCDLSPGLHHPKMTFEFGAIPKAVDILSNALLKTAQKHNHN